MGEFKTRKQELQYREGKASSPTRALKRESPWVGCASSSSSCIAGRFIGYGYLEVDGCLSNQKLTVRYLQDNQKSCQFLHKAHHHPVALPVPSSLPPPTLQNQQLEKDGGEKKASKLALYPQQLPWVFQGEGGNWILNHIKNRDDGWILGILFPELKLSGA